MNFGQILALAEKLNVPGLVAQGIDFINEVKENAARAKHVLTDGEQAELEQIHAEALAAADRLDAKLKDAETR